MKPRYNNKQSLMVHATIKSDTGKKHLSASRKMFILLFILQNSFLHFLLSGQSEQAMLIACLLKSLLIPLPTTPCSPWSYSWNGPMPVTLRASSLVTTSCL